jgi:hypothetical protein
MLITEVIVAVLVRATARVKAVELMMESLREYLIFKVINTTEKIKEEFSDFYTAVLCMAEYQESNNGELHI